MTQVGDYLILSDSPALPMVVYNEGQELLRITTEPRLVLADEVTVDEAAAGFVAAVNEILRRAGY